MQDLARSGVCSLSLTGLRTPDLGTNLLSWRTAEDYVYLSYGMAVVGRLLEDVWRPQCLFPQVSEWEDSIVDDRQRPVHSAIGLYRAGTWPQRMLLRKCFAWNESR